MYNGEKFLSQSIESCLNQTYKNLELIIVYELSVDNTLAIINKYATLDNRIKVISNEEKQNLPAALNIGHTAATGNMFSWTSDDNIYEKNAFEVMISTLIDEKVDIVYADMIIIDDKGKKCRDFLFINFENVLFRNYVGNCFLYTKEVFDRNRGYDENCFLVEDYDFWLRAIAHSLFYQCKKKLYRYRKHDTSLTHQIAVNPEKKQQWNSSVTRMFQAFATIFLEKEAESMAEFLAKSLNYQQIPFEWIVDNDAVIRGFKDKLAQNENFKSRTAIEKVFMNRTVELMVQDKGDKNNFSKSLYILKKYGLVLDKKAIKTMVKYSFFKK